MLPTLENLYEPTMRIGRTLDNISVNLQLIEKDMKIAPIVKSGTVYNKEKSKPAPLLILVIFLTAKENRSSF